MGYWGTLQCVSRKKILLYVLALSLVLLQGGRWWYPTEPLAPLAAVGAATSTSTSNAPLYKVVRVVDGDTVVLAMEGGDTKVRLIGVNTPEVVDPRRPVQCFGKEASLKTKELLKDTAVRVELDPSQGTLDKYGRTLAYLFLPDGTNVNQTLIEEGYAYEYTYRTPYAYQAAFKAAQVRAQQHAAGLWALGACQ